MADEEMMVLEDEEASASGPVRESPYEYDLFVIGGGSGGISAAKEASKLGAKVGLADFVSKSPKGTAWGLGGTCVNVGCIPKKLMHFSGQFGDSYEDSRATGWDLPETKEHNWQKMVLKVQAHIKKLNWGYKVALIEHNVTYFNNLAEFADPHTVVVRGRQLRDGTGKEKSRVTSEHFLIAVGQRPSYGDLPGAKECCITSDDLFATKLLDGPVLVIGGSYIALECAGFLHSVGKDVTVMIRSIVLRGFDREMSDMVQAYMEESGVKFLKGAAPSRFEKVEGGMIRVEYTQDATLHTGEYRHVLLAIGRQAVTQSLNLPCIGVETHPTNLKVIVDPTDRSSVPHIWSIGDTALNRWELTPVAVKAGILLARRIFAGATVAMRYDLIPTTVFTPLEYACVGYSEEQAIEKYGSEDVEVYHSAFTPLEWNFTDRRREQKAFAKLVCVISQREKIVGVHFVGPNAGEVVQGFAVAVQAGATKEVFDMTVGIHPTCAEEFTNMKVTKRSGQAAAKTGC